jgi:hypothetical protein
MMNCWFLTAEICWKLIAEFCWKILAVYKYSKSEIRSINATFLIAYFCRISLTIKVSKTSSMYLLLAAGEISHPQTNQNDQLGTG